MNLQLLKFLGLWVIFCALPQTSISQIAEEESLKFNLINSNSDRIIAPLKEGNTLKIYLSHYNLKVFTIAAVQVPPETQSLKMKCTGAINQERIENLAPFSLFGDDGKSNYQGTAALPGSYTFTGESLKGSTLLDDFRANFSFVNTLPGPMRLVLLNADKDLPVCSFTEEDMGIINTSGLKMKTFSFELNQYPPNTQSVRFILQGPIQYQRLESSMPFSLFGDVITNGDFYGANAIQGNYSLIVQTYDAVQGKGNLIRTMIFRFKME